MIQILRTHSLDVSYRIVSLILVPIIEAMGDTTKCKLQNSARENIDKEILSYLEKKCIYHYSSDFEQHVSPKSDKCWHR
jgi:hypothetical protein